jgi:hypothetical protein
MNGQPLVPLWVALVIGASGAAIGFVLAVPPTSTVSWLNDSLRIILGAVNAALIFVAAFLNIKKP